jgi:hypothetical protein
VVKWPSDRAVEAYSFIPFIYKIISIYVMKKANLTPRHV